MIVGYDGSMSSKAALMVAIERAQRIGDGLYLVCVREQHLEADPVQEARLHHDLDYAVTLCREAGVKGEARLLQGVGTVGEQLVQFARENGAGEIVLGITKLSRVSKLLLGSTAQYVILKAPCPVLTVK